MSVKSFISYISLEKKYSEAKKILYKIGNIEIFNEHLLGMFLSFIFSYITIHLFISTINKISFTPYIIYRLILGVILLGFV